MSRPDPSPTNDDARFPDGPWTGFFLQPEVPGRHIMELVLSFADGEMTGEGRDRVGPFLIRGRFQAEDGQCWWTKSYVGKHEVTYRGFNEGKGIWGTWQIESWWKGGFHIWPEGMSDPTQPSRGESEDVPSYVEEFSDAEADAVMVTVGS